MEAPGGGERQKNKMDGSEEKEEGEGNKRMVAVTSKTERGEYR